MIDESEQRTSDAQQIQALNATLQKERRLATLLRAELYEAKETAEDLKAELQGARAELVAHRALRKELTETVGNLEDQLRLRFEELAVLQRQLIRSNYVWRFKGLIGKAKRRFGAA